jgi:class 3 adenylate cyclase
LNIAQWLEEIGFGNYSELFEENGIDASILSELTNDDLKDIGIARLGDRKKILLAAASAAVSSDDDSATSSQAAAKTTPPPPPPEPGNTGRHISAAANNTAAEAENRQLSVMFCDLVGSTELSTKIDAEDLREIINRFQHTCTQIAQQAGGFVARYSGDGILVYFGYPRAAEDDPVRAVNCGLQITQAVARTNTQVRVGIATGRVIVGDLLGTGPAEERTVVGETPNLAARLQGLAGINAVVISDTTRQLVGGVYTFRDLGRHSLKGFANPVPAWEVSGESSVKSRFMARAGQSTSDLVGRESELRLLLDRWQAALDGEGQTVFVSGEAGIGKSHLIEALRAQTSAHNPRVVRYQCSAHRQRTVSGDTPTTARRKLRTSRRQRRKTGQTGTVTDDRHHSAHDARPAFTCPFGDTRYC